MVQGYGKRDCIDRENFIIDWNESVIIYQKDAVTCIGVIPANQLHFQPITLDCHRVVLEMHPVGRSVGDGRDTVARMRV